MENYETFKEFAVGLENALSNFVEAHTDPTNNGFKTIGHCIVETADEDDTYNKAAEAAAQTWDWYKCSGCGRISSQNEDECYQCENAEWLIFDGPEHELIEPAIDELYGMFGKIAPPWTHEFYFRGHYITEHRYKELIELVDLGCTSMEPEEVAEYLYDNSGPVRDAREMLKDIRRSGGWEKIAAITAALHANHYGGSILEDYMDIEWDDVNNIQNNGLTAVFQQSELEEYATENA